MPQNRIVDARSDGDSDSDNTDSEGGNNSNSDDEQDEEQNEGLEEDNDEGDEGDYEDGPSAGTVIVKADCGTLYAHFCVRICSEVISHNSSTVRFHTCSIIIIFYMLRISLCTDITLGTLIDRYGDEEEAHENAMKDNNNNAGAVAPLNHVLQWGLGEVGMSDVNLASAGDGMLD